MRQRFFILLFVNQFLLFLAVRGQFIEKNNFSYKNSTYHAFSIIIDSSLISRVSFLENKNQSPLESILDSLGKKLKKPFFAITASIVDSLCRPLGLYINESKVSREINHGSGNGNFFLKPNGVFYIDPLLKAEVVDTPSFNFNNGISSGIQSGPMLLVKGEINKAFNENSKNRNVRCGVGVYAQGAEKWLVFIKSVNPVTFFEFAEVFRDMYRCGNALTLESGVNCSIHLPSEKTNALETKVLCRYLIITM